MKWQKYSEYKDSGTEVLGAIPVDWKTQKLKFNSYIKGRIGWQNLRSDEFTDEGPYLVTGMHFKDGDVDWNVCYHVTEDRYLMAPEIFVQEGDVLMTKDGSIGKLAYIRYLPCRATLNSHLLTIRPLMKVYDSKFLYYLLSSEIFQHFVLIEQKGTTFYGITQESVENFPALFPSVAEQRAVAAYLDRETERLDTLIAKKDRQIELLQEKRATLVSHAVTKGLEPNAKKKDSGIEWLGEIPQGWEVKALKFVLKNLDHRRVPLSSEERSFMAKEYPYYGASGIIDYVDDFLFDEPLLLVAEDGANLLSRSTPLAFIADGRYWVNNHAHILKPVNGNLKFWESVLQTFNYTPLITGAAQPKLTAENLANIVLPCPPFAEQSMIKEFLERETGLIDNLTAKIKESITKLHEYRTVLISAAVTGRIDVRKEAT